MTGSVPQVDIEASVLTAGTVAVGGSVTGEIGAPGDHDWFAVTLEAGKTYRIDVRGADTRHGTLGNPFLVGMYDEDGQLIDGTSADDGGKGKNSLTLFSPATSGTYYVAAGGHRTSTGTYTVAVDENPEDDYAASVATTGAVAVGGTATGEISLLDGARDHDWFAVELEAGKTYRVEVKGSGTGNGKLAYPVLVGMYDADGTFIAGTGEGGLSTRYDSVKFFSPATSGTYYMAASARGSETGTYTVAVREGPEDDYAASVATTGTVEVGGSVTGKIEYLHGDHDWFAVELEAGKTYQIDVKRTSVRYEAVVDPDLVGIFDKDGQFIPGTDAKEIGEARKGFTPDTSGTYYVAAGAWKDAYTGTYTVAVEELPGDDYAASTATTGTVEVGGSATGEITQIVGVRDRDWFAVDLEAGKAYRIDVKGSATGDGTLRDPYLYAIHNKYGVLHAFGNDNGGEGLNSRKVFVPASSDTFYVEVLSNGSIYSSGYTGTYTVAVEEAPFPSDDYAASVATTGTVAVGGSVMGNIQWNGDHDWFAVDLEAGKTYRIEVKGRYTGNGSLRDPNLVGIYDKDGQFIDGTRDRDSGWNYDSLKDFTPDASGTYYVVAAAGGYLIQAAGGAFTGTYTVVVGKPADDYAASVATTGTVAAGGSATGKIELSTNGRDQDWFAVELEAGKSYRIEVKGADSRDGTLRDPVLVGVFDKDGQGIAGTGDDDGGDRRNSLKVFTPETSGTYYVAVGGGFDDSSAIGTYRVVVTEVPDDYAASVATTGSVAVGGSAAGDIQWRDDRDWFAVELEAGNAYRIEVKGADTGDGTLRYPVLVGVYDKDGTYIDGTGDADSGAVLNNRKVFTPETTGTYYVAARSGFTYLNLKGTYTVRSMRCRRTTTWPRRRWPRWRWAMSGSSRAGWRCSRSASRTPRRARSRWRGPSAGAPRPGTITTPPPGRAF